MANIKQRINKIRWQFKLVYARHKLKGVFNYILSMIEANLRLPFVLAKPIKVRISVIEGICNLSCKTCLPFLPERRSELSFEVFKKILDGLKYIPWVNISGWGEPFMTKDIFKIIEYAKANNCRINVITNMTLIDEEAATKIVKMQLDSLGISFDAATKQLFEKIRTGANFDAIINNIKTLNRIKKSLYSKKPRLSFQVTALKENIHEIPAIVELAHQLGVLEVTVTPLNVRDTGLATEEQSLTNYPELSEDFFPEAREKAKKYGVVFRWHGCIKEHMEKLCCCKRPWLMLDVLMDGTVRACCLFHAALGNIITDDIASIWNNEKFRLIRKIVRKEGSLCCHCLKALNQLKV